MSARATGLLGDERDLKSRALKTVVAVFLAALPLLAACTSPTAPGAASVPVGLVVATDSGTIIVVHGTSASQGFHVRADKNTQAFTVTFTDNRGQPLDVSGRSMEGDMESRAVASYEPTSPGGFSGAIHGKLVGLTRVRFRLLAGADSTSDAVYTSPWIPVVVEP